jgi:hypothetical protein
MNSIQDAVAVAVIPQKPVSDVAGMQAGQTATSCMQHHDIPYDNCCKTLSKSRIQSSSPQGQISHVMSSTRQPHVQGPARCFVNASVNKEYLNALHTCHRTIPLPHSTTRSPLHLHLADRTPINYFRINTSEHRLQQHLILILTTISRNQKPYCTPPKIPHTFGSRLIPLSRRRSQLWPAQQSA